MERARYRQSDLRRMALGVRTIPSLFIALTSYKLLAVLLLMETFLLPGTFVVGGLARCCSWPAPWCAWPSPCCSAG